MKIFFFLFLFVSSLSFGQFVSYADPDPSNHSYFPDGFQKDYAPGAPESIEIKQNIYNITGSPYITDGYTQGSTKLFDKKGFTAPMRYNAAIDVVEFLDDDQKTKELLRRPYIKASFNGKTYEVLPYIKNEEKRLAYFNRLNSGKIQLLFKPMKRIKVGSQKFQGKFQARYKDVSMYYLKLEGKPAVVISLSKTSLLSKLNDQKVRVSKFISDYDLNLKKEADAVRLIEFYNSLLSPEPSTKMAQS